MGTMRQQEVITHKVDWVTVMLYAVMVIWGWLNIYSASYEESQPFFDKDLFPKWIVICDMSIAFFETSLV